jgi:hypothetical protein
MPVDKKSSPPYLDHVLLYIKHAFSRSPSGVEIAVSVKGIRRFFNIDSKDRSASSFISLRLIEMVEKSMAKKKADGRYTVNRSVLNG